MKKIKKLKNVQLRNVYIDISEIIAKCCTWTLMSTILLFITGSPAGLSCVNGVRRSSAKT